MYINEINVKNFGPIVEQKFELIPEGINLIIGYNTTGKTQLLASIYAAFFDDGILQYHDSMIDEASTCLRITSDGNTFDLARRYINKSSHLFMNNFKDLEFASKIKRENLFFYFPDFERNVDKKYSKSAIQNAFKFLTTLGLQSHHILGTCQAKKETGYLMSFGEQRYLELVCFLSEIPQGSIVIGDSLLSKFDYTTCKMVFEVFAKMKGLQFILAENPHSVERVVCDNINVLCLASPSERLNPVSYNYKMIPRNSRKMNRKLEAAGVDTEEAIIPISFCLGSVFPEGESKEIELKEIKGQRVCESIIANAEVYINAYLNSALEKTGKIYWGIDDKKRIKGVKLLYQDIDFIQRRISETMSKSEPFISPDLYNIIFNKVAASNGEIQTGVYVVEIDVYPHHADRLYSTSKGEVYIKTPGGKQKLSNLQIQEQILLRASNYYDRK